MSYSPSTLFDREGYLSIKEYLADIDAMKKEGPWKLPLHFGDRLHLAFLALIARSSWFADSLFLKFPSSHSPAYSMLLSYAKKKGLYDVVTEKNLNFPGYYSYFIEKQFEANDKMLTLSGQGVATDKATALSKALGEVLERMISGLLDHNNDILVSSPNELLGKSSVYYPPQFHRHLPIQKKVHTELMFDDTHPIQWVAGRNLVTGDSTFIPKQITSWFSAAHREKTQFMNTTTSGCAGYFTKDGAVLRGLLETVQRDAFLTHWLTQSEPKLVDVETLPDSQKKFVAEFASRGVSLYVLDITSLRIPSICIAAINASAQKPQVVVSACSALNFEDAINGALREMLTCAGMFSYVPTEEEEQLIKRSSSKPFVSDLGKIGRQLFWRGNEQLKEFEWFISGPSISFDNLCRRNLHAGGGDRSRLSVCIDTLKQYGRDYYPIAYHPRNRIEDELGYYIAQVYIPKAFPFYLLEKHGTFDSDRLREFAASNNRLNWKLNPLPHMFS